MNATEQFLNLADEEHRTRVAAWLADAASWEGLRDAFLSTIDEYADGLCRRPLDWCIQSHEAGGGWRPVFSHLEIRPNESWMARMKQTMLARRDHAARAFYHGFPDEAEVHHEIETFLYFQMPLWHHQLPGWSVARQSILDVSEHVINAVDGVPAWYDWAAQGFRSTYLGTRSIRDGKPFDYQEANHWRFVGLAITAHAITADERYLDLAKGYAHTWCRHIDAEYARGGVIRCSILPENAQASEMLYSGTQDGAAREYQVFYSEAAANTAHDIVCGLLDVYQLTADSECLRCARMLLDQFLEHQHDGRPATNFQGGSWCRPFDPAAPLDLEHAVSQKEQFIVRMALRHDIVTGEQRYRTSMVDWARAIDEQKWISDQSMIAPLIAGWYYQRDSAYLERAFAMALRLWATTDGNDNPHMCGCRNRYGSKFLTEILYLPITGLFDAGTRGNLPMRAQLEPLALGQGGTDLFMAPAPLR
ncbi:MAG: hypothetical protein PF961_15260 [Planctomycetota bacterium]|jgi:hypothetical protein|nr:hypothetical protein [Planctomycetota bacterium]